MTRVYVRHKLTNDGYTVSQKVLDDAKRRGEITRAMPSADCKHCGRTFRGAGVGRHEKRCATFACIVPGCLSRLGAYSSYCVDHYKVHRTVSFYGMTAVEYLAMFEAQGGRCKICDKLMKPKGVSRGTTAGVICIDHCHETGEVRGLLCHTCNLAIGLMQNDALWLRAAANYIDETRKQRALT